MTKQSNNSSGNKGSDLDKMRDETLGKIGKQAEKTPTYDEEADKTKKYFLNEEDQSKASELWELGKDKEEIGKIKVFVSHIEKNYDINKLPLYVYVDESYYSSCAANAYHMFILKYLVEPEKGKTYSRYTPELIKHLKGIVSKIENSKELKIEFAQNSDNDDKYILAQHVKESLTALMYLYYEIQNEKLLCLQTYRKLIDHISILPFSDKDSERTRWYGESFDRFMKSIEKNNVASIGKKIFGNNSDLIKSYIRALSCADDSRPILILGETGTGKELIVQTIHQFSDRNQNVLLPLNCGAITESLFDAEVSGILKGVATGVGTRLGIFLSACKKGKDGYVVIKDQIQFLKASGKDKKPTQEDLARVGGTVFLDEINTISTELQTKLLRIIQENKVRVAGEYDNREFNVKLICAANQDLHKLIEKGNFKEDLYHRIAACVVYLPPLREMKESLPDIAKSTVKAISKEISLLDTIELSEAALKKIMNYQWPGNFRELERVLYGALIDLRLEEKSKITGSHIKFSESQEEYVDISVNSLIRYKYDQLLKIYLEGALKANDGNQSTAARMIEMGRSRFRRKLVKYNIIKE